MLQGDKSRSSNNSKHVSTGASSRPGWEGTTTQNDKCADSKDLRQGLPHLTDTCYMASKQLEWTATPEREGKQAYEQQRTRTTNQATTTQPSFLTADAFAAVLGAVPADDWCRTWAADRTMMLRRTSKTVKEVVDKLRLPAFVCLSRSFLNDTRYGTAAEKLQFVFRQLAALTARCSITTLELCHCEMKGQDTERLAGVLGQCAVLSHLNLCCNPIGAKGAGKLSGVLAQSSALAYLNLSRNELSDDGAGRLAGVMGQLRALVHLDLSRNCINANGAWRLAGVLGQCPALAHLDLSGNGIRDDGAGRLAGLLGQLRALTHLDLKSNAIRDHGAGRLAGVLGQCVLLAHLDLSDNEIGDAGAESLAEVLVQCTALAHLDLCDNRIETSGAGRLRASWCGKASGLLL